MRQKRKLKFEDCKNCLEVTQLENKSAGKKESYYYYTLFILGKYKCKMIQIKVKSYI